MNKSDTESNAQIIRTTARLAAEYLAATLAPDSHLSDDDTDYLPAASCILTACMNALANDDLAFDPSNTPSCDDLINRIKSLDNSDYLLDDLHCAEFDNPLSSLLDDDAFYDKYYPAP